MTKGCGISNKIPNIQTGKSQSIRKLNVPLNSYNSTYEMICRGVCGAVRGTPESIVSSSSVDPLWGQLNCYW